MVEDEVNSSKVAGSHFLKCFNVLNDHQRSVSGESYQLRLALLHVILPLSPLLSQVVESPVQPFLHPPHVITAHLEHGPRPVQPRQPEAPHEILDGPDLGEAESIAGQHQDRGGGVELLLALQHHAQLLPHHLHPPGAERTKNLVNLKLYCNVTGYSRSAEVSKNCLLTARHKCYHQLL